MPFVDDTGVYDRVTEIIGVDECEERAFHSKRIGEKLHINKKFPVPSQRLFSSHSGTKVHRQIEDFIRNKLGLPPLKHKINKSEIEYEKKIFQDEKLRDAINLKIVNASNNFMEFWKYFKPIPIASEQIVKGVIGERRIKGEIDFVGAYKRRFLDMYFGFISDGNPEDWVIVITDWKTGKRHMKTHTYQLSAYYELASREVLPQLLSSGKYKYYKVNGIPIAMDVYFGDNNFKAVAVKVDTDHFLDLSNKFHKARRIPINAKGNINVGMKCVFCNYRDRCSLIQTSEEVIYQSAEQ